MLKNNAIPTPAAVFIALTVGAVPSAALAADCSGGQSSFSNETIYSVNGSTSMACSQDITIVNTNGSWNGGDNTGGTHGVYMYAGNIDLSGKLIVTVSGLNADAINLKASGSAGSPTTLTIGDGARIRATGSSGDGINVALYQGSGSVTLGNDVDISSRVGVAVRANLSPNAGEYNHVKIGERATITGEATSASETSGEGYAVFAGNRNRNSDTQNGSAFVVINRGSHISTTNSGTALTHAVYANKGGVIQLGDSAYVETSGTRANALHATVGTDTQNQKGGIIELTGGAEVIVSYDTAYAVYAKGVGSRIVSQKTALETVSELNDYIAGSGTSTATSGKFLITGNMLATEGGQIALVMTDGTQFNGGASTDSETGTVSLDISGQNSRWNMNQDSDVTTLSLGNKTRIHYDYTDGVFKTLTVNGNYHSNNGVIAMNTVLEGDGSLTDKLVIKGDTSGHTDISITNAGGNGALTTQGIELVQVEGNSAGTFGNSQRIVGGAFDYFVRSGSTIAGANDSSWYLVSDYSPVIPPVNPPVDPPVNPPVNPPVTPPVTPEVSTPKPVYRPEAGSYVANLSAANTLFITRLHDRLGETQYTDALTGEQKVTNMWLRNVGGHNRFHDGSGQLKTTSNRYVMQLGGDLAQWTRNGMDRWHVGAMAGYGNSHSKTRSNVTGYTSKGSVNGYSVGLYGTWYANSVDKSGSYLDSWVQYGWFDNEVNGERLAAEKYKSSGVTASLEGGYSIKLADSERSSFWLQPKAQLVWLGVTADSHRENNGSRIKYDTSGNLMTRVGMRAFMNGHSAVDDGKDRTFQPFIEANWIHNTEDYSVEMDNRKSSQSGAKNIGEAKIGVEGQVSKRLNLWGNVSQQIGNDSYSDTQAMLGAKYSF